MSAPAHIPLMPLLTLESLLLGVVPFAWPLTQFCTWALQKQELSEAPVRSVLCNRQGVHEFILLSCDVNTARGIVALWFRIERHPSSQGVGVLLNKSKPAVDTLKASTNLQALREPCEARDSFTYSPHDNPREVLKFKHIAEMCRYFTGHSCEYSLLGANCRWICYALLECLREAQPCYGGTWFPSRNERPTADVRAAQLAKSHYLKDKHSTCCGSRYLVCPNFGAHVARATAGLASIAVVSSGQTTRKGGSQNANPEVVYRTPRSLPESAVPHHQPSASTTDAVPQPPSTNGPLSINTNTVSVPESPLGTSATQPSRQQNDVSPLPVGDNITQHAQSPPISEDMSNSSYPQQRNTAPPVKHTVSQTTGETTSHCSGCQCASHSGHHQHISNHSQHGMTPSQSLLSETRGDDVSRLASRLSSVHIQPNIPAARVSHGQWFGENITIPREPSPSEASAVRSCSCCGPHGNVPTQRPASFVPSPTVSNETYHSHGAVYSTHSGRIHPGVSQRSATSSTGAGSTHRNNNMVPMTTHHSSDYDRYSTQTIPRSSLPSTHGSHTRSVSDGTNAFNMPHQRPPPLSFPDPSAGGVTPGYNMNHNRTSSLGTNYPSYDHQSSMHTQGCQHTHSHPQTEHIINSMGPVSPGYPFTHVNSTPMPRRTHEVPPSPLHTHQGIRENTHVCSNQSRNSTRDSYQGPGNCAHGPSPSLPRHPVNRNSMNQPQTFHNHTQVPPSPGYNSNTLEEHYHSAQHNLYRIPEDAPQPELETQWNLADAFMGVDLSEYGLQTMLPNYTQPLPSSDPLAQLASNYPHAQHPEAAFQQSYMPSGLPADSYSQPEPPNRQWTQEVWGDQEFAQPLRTDSPTQLDYPLNEGVYPIPPEPPILTRMPDPRDYMPSNF